MPRDLWDGRRVGEGKEEVEGVLVRSGLGETRDGSKFSGREGEEMEEEEEEEEER